MTILRLFLGALVLGGALFWFLTGPERVGVASLEGLSGDAARGETVFYASGCASCHAAPGAEGAAKLQLGGGLAFHTDFGTFYAPNISPHENGIGGWSAADLVNAVKYGVSPEGAHYYPAFPYTSYVNAELADLVDLKAFLDTLEPVATENKAHEVGFPFSFRRILGGWKLLFASDEWVAAANGPDQERGRYLVEALGHCAECHTSRNALGGLKRGLWMAGGPNPDGKGRIPNITPHESGIGSWSRDEIIEYLTSGFTPDFDVAGGQMADVVLNTGELSAEDRGAIADYLLALEPLPRVE